MKPRRRHAFMLGFIFLNSILQCDSYKPVVICHGIFDHRDSLVSMAQRIRQIHPGTEVTIIDKLHGWHSITPIWYQVKVFSSVLKPIMAANPDGVHLIGFSQGGLVARGLIQSISNHNIQNFISLSSPQGGQYGDEFLRVFFPQAMKLNAWKVFYSKLGQSMSVSNYWRDPHHIHKFINQSNFLARVDNLVLSNNSMNYKNNLTKLRKMILIGGPDDGIICPWQSSQFSFFNKNETVVDMRNRLEYRQDLFGLKTLDKDKKIIRITVPGVKHLEWHRNISVIDNYILPYLD